MSALDVRATHFNHPKIAAPLNTKNNGATFLLLGFYCEMSSTFERHEVCRRGACFKFISRSSVQTKDKFEESMLIILNVQCAA